MAVAERSFKNEMQKLRSGAGEVVEGDAILAIAKALLQAGVAYLGGYQGSPTGALMDVFVDSDALLRELGVHFECSASEMVAAASLAASVNYPLRGAVVWKSVVGTNVACEALSNLSSGGVRGGAVVIVGEDYGEGSAIMQERTHAFAMKSQMWLIDPRPNLPSIVDMVSNAFELSEASNTPVMVELRIRACHVTGSFIAKDNQRPQMTVGEAAANPVRDVNRIVLPPAAFLHEKEKITKRWPAAVNFVRERRLNEWFGPKDGSVGIIVLGGLYNTLNRALEKAGLSDVYGSSQVPIYCLNVSYPLIPEEVAAFCVGKAAVMVVEEGQPEFVEHELNTLVRRADLSTRILGKELLPRAGEYTVPVLRDKLVDFLQRWAPESAPPATSAAPADLELEKQVPPRPVAFCTGCPERPIFSAMKLVQRDLGPIHVSADVGCHLFSILPPFHIGNTTMGYGLGPAGASAFRPREGPGAKRAVAMMGDGGFWHNGLATGIANAVFNRDDTVTLIVDNGYTAATGGQHILSSKADNATLSTKHPIEAAVRGVGVTSVRTLTNTYDVATLRAALKTALTAPEKGPKVIVAQSECMLNKQRRIKPLMEKAAKAGQRVVRERFGVDSETCTGDHACIRLSGCPSLTVRSNPDPLREHPVTHIDNSCVGCGNCGEVAHAAILCPSFYKMRIVLNPSRWEQAWHRLRQMVIRRLQSRYEQAIAQRAY